ncbi:zf-TFIIB domain-containing protein [uncultured Desulfobulbus sp.]|uniref:TFIIB-type zinc ribbon-containing protein n=1 Tax=uncultured Desulfobulbus sp. TaxID=239745 RepID=UPI0029C84AD2|nr:zf-TFIIB domain-containing protein [uncultured Desulfobulbus sp.]
MNCPVCDTKLRPVDRHGVEIDLCPDCKGIWLDRGELDKILEIANGNRSENRGSDERRMSETTSVDRDADRFRDHKEKEHYDHDDDDDDDRYRRKDEKIDPKTGKPRKREGIFGEIFDIFG